MIALVLSSCSQYSNSPVSKAYHNLTARDNAYFLARERTKEVDAKIVEMNVDDYNKVLNVVIPFDTVKLQSQKAVLEDILKKCALPITKHKNSKWVDDSYILVGKARMYQGEFKMGTETFKYVNAKSKDDNDRHAALIQLMRAYIIMKEYKNAASVSFYLKKQKLNVINSREFYLTQAQYHKVHEEYKEALQYLELASPLMKGRDNKSRVHFIIGQINQLLKNDSSSYKHYRQVLKHSPPYELSFYTKLYMAQVTELSNNSDKKKIDKYFKKLVKDQKNLEYKDKIYYEMAKFELKQKNNEKAIEYFNKSLRANKGNKFQQGATFLAMGETYYERLQNYEMAKMYYDSTVSVWDKEDKNYKKIADRQKILAEFVEQITTIKREDSLLRVANLDTAALSKLIDQLIKEEEEAFKREQEANKKLLAQKNNGGGQNQINSANLNTDPFADQSATWYFYNSGAIAKGQVEFIRKWGDRKQEDDWRRSKKEINLDNLTSNNQNKSIDSLGNPVNNNSDIKEVKFVPDRSKYYKDIPYSSEQQTESNKKISEAMYKLGKIYNLKLEEPINAIKTFEDLLKRYPQYEDYAEVLYFLYLINKKLENKEREIFYKNKLINEYPNSLYAKLLLNPKYLVENQANNVKAGEMYKEAFTCYEKGNYQNADSLITLTKTLYPDNNINDKLDFLHVILLGKKKEYTLYEEGLEKFITDHNSSALLPRAKEMLSTYKEKGGQAVPVNKPQ